MIKRILFLFVLYALSYIVSFAQTSLSGYVGDDLYIDAPSSKNSNWPDLYGVAWDVYSGDASCVTLGNAYSTPLMVRIFSEGKVRIRCKAEFYDKEELSKGKNTQTSYYDITCIAKSSDPDPNPNQNPDPNPSITDGTWFQDYTEEGYYMLFYAYKHASTGEMVCMVSRSAQGSSTITYANGKVTIPSYAKGIKVYMIDNAAFQDLSGLTELVIPSTVEWVSSNITLGCDNLKKVTCNATTPPSYSAFSSSSSPIFDYSTLYNGILYVPVGCKSKYQNAKGWKDFKTIKEIGESDDIKVSNITLNTTSASISVGETLQLSATVYPNNATNKSVTWSTNNNTVATVSNTGFVTAKSAGTATITCKANDGSGIYATCVINVVRENSININATNFPDEAFRKYLLSQDYGKDGILTESEISEITEINVYGTSSSPGKIKSLKGIEYFTALTYLNCYKNQLTALDVSNNTALTWLDCRYNQLTTLDVSKSTALTRLECGGNQLTILDVSKNTALTYLNCLRNQLTTLDVSKNAELEFLQFNINKLTVIDLSKNTALKTLYCHDNLLTTLDVSKNTALETLYCHDNQLTTLNVSNTALKSLSCYDNQLAALDVSKNTALINLSCYSNKINGTDTDNLIKSLPVNTTNNLHRFRFIDHTNELEGNVGTKAQMAAAKAKGWTPQIL